MAKTIREKVERIMREYPQTRNDDNLLIVKYWQDHCGLTAEQAKFIFHFMKESTPVDSITRARRLIQEEGQLLPTVSVEAKRRGREHNMRNAVLRGEVIY